MATPQSLEEKIASLEVQLQSARKRNQEICSQQNPKFLRSSQAPSEHPQRPRPSARYDRDVSDLAMSRDSPKFLNSVEYSEPHPELRRVPYAAFPPYAYAPPQMYPPSMMMPNMYQVPMMVPQSFPRENWPLEEPEAPKEHELAQAKKALESYKEQVSQLREQLKDIRSDPKELDCAHEVLNNANLELQHQREVNTHLENKFSVARTQLRTMERELEKAQEQNNALNTDLEDSKEKYSALQKTLNYERTAHKNELAFLEARNHEAPTRRQQTSAAEPRELHEKTSEDRALPGPSANLQHYLTTLQLEKARLENEFHRLPGQPRNMADKKRKQDLQLELEIVQTNVNNLKSKLKKTHYR